MQQENGRTPVFVGLRRTKNNLPVDKVGSAINGVNDPGGGICQSTLLSSGNSFLSNEANIRGIESNG